MKENSTTVRERKQIEKLTQNEQELTESTAAWRAGEE